MARVGLPHGTRGFRLRLLPSGPDLVRVPASRGTRPSTPPRRTDPDGQSLGTVVGPARADCGLQGTADSPPSTVRCQAYLPAICSRRLIDVDTASFFAIVVVAAVAAITVAVVPKQFAPPVVVLELLLGIVIGPHVLHLAHDSSFIEFFSNLGLGMLFFFAGYEIDFGRIKGAPMKLGTWGWLLSVALAYGIGGALAAAGIVVSFLYTGSAMATKAIGTPIPILRDNGELKTRFGTYLLAAGGAGGFGPILV